MTRLDLAEIMLADAQVCLDNGRYRSAVSRAYYTCYHAAKACLEARGIFVGSRDAHEACLRLFGLHLVRGGTFSATMGRSFNILQQWRRDADYKQ